MILSGVHACFVCKKSGDGVKRCIIPLCGKFYHTDCIMAYSATQPHNKGFRCPLHVCLSCHITNPLNICSSKGERHCWLWSNQPSTFSSSKLGHKMPQDASMLVCFTILLKPGSFFARLQLGDMWGFLTGQRIKNRAVNIYLKCSVLPLIRKV